MVIDDDDYDNDGNGDDYDNDCDDDFNDDYDDDGYGDDDCYCISNVITLLAIDGWHTDRSHTT